MMSKLSKWILGLFGWKIEGRYPPPEEVPKAVLIVIPHTSNWDFPLGLLVRSAIGADIKFVGKSSLFKPPHGWLFRALGGYPVDRSKSTNYVQMMVDIFNREKTFHVVIAPEGTRSKVDRLRTGFYYIAKGAGIPIIMCRFDYERKVVEFREPYYPTGDVEKDFEVINDYFRNVKGKNPEQGYLYNG